MATAGKVEGGVLAAVSVPHLEAEILAVAALVIVPCVAATDIFILLVVDKSRILLAAAE